MLYNTRCGVNRFAAFSIRQEGAVMYKENQQLKVFRAVLIGMLVGW